MPFELTIADCVIFGVVALLAFIGLFRGLSGELGSLLGISAALGAGCMLYNPAKLIAVNLGINTQGWGGMSAVAIDFIFSVIIFGIVRKIVSKFLSFCLGWVMNTFLGLLSGLVKGAMLVGGLSGIGWLPAGEYSTGPLIPYSSVIRYVAVRADAIAANTVQIAEPVQ